jgi:lantibiotic biosynthesis protein
VKPNVESPPAAGHSNARENAREKRRRSGLFEPLDWGLARAPLLPVEAHLACAVDELSAGYSLLPQDRRVQAALAVGTTDLLGALARARTGDRDEPRLRGKLHRYLIRMATRSTPYGLFAGAALIGWGPATDCALAMRVPRTRSRPDMEWLLDLVLTLERDPEIRRHLRLFTNPAVLIRAGRVFLSERAPTGNGDVAPSPVSLRATAAVRLALAAARTPIHYGQLAEALGTTAGATPEKVERLISELWQHTVLLTDLRPPLTDEHPARYVRERLREIPAAQQTADGLGALLRALERWDELALEDRAEAWPALVGQARRVHDIPASRTPIQLDMALALDGAHVHASVAAEAASAAELLLRISPYPRGLPHIQQYRQAFETRYGANREVPLLELLDPQFGLGPPSAQAHGWDGLDPRRSAARQQTLFDLALATHRDRRAVVELDDVLLDSLETWSPVADAAPPSVELLVLVAARSAASIDAGEFQIVVGPNVGANAAGRNLGRFSDLLGQPARTSLEQVATAEALHDRDRVAAELVYLPQRTRLANVTIRPAIRNREIVLGTSPGVPPDHVISPSELVVGLRDGRFYARWPRGSADVIAFQGHMLNSIQAPPAVRFLEDIARDQYVLLSSFDWGTAARFPFLPRIQHGRVVLALAQWRIDAATRATELPAEPRDTFDEALIAWRRNWSVPRHVYLASGDNRLLLDLDDPSHTEQLREELRRLPDGGSLLVQEGLPAPAEAWLEGPDGHYMTELVVPLVLRAGAASRTAEPPVSPPRAAPVAPADSRLRPPGSDWLFLKLYCPRSLEEDVIAGPLRKFGQFIRSAGLADAWFFVRFADPDPHLRIRFHGDPHTLMGELLTQVCGWATDLIADGTCHRFGFDTYDRELERYGGESGIDLAEAVFSADSAAVAELLHLSREELVTLDTTTLAVLSIDDLLAGLGTSEPERLAWCRDRVSLSPPDGREFRERQQQLRVLLGHADSLPQVPGAGPLAQVLAARRQALVPIAARLDALACQDELSQPKASLWRSYVHLHCNRLLATDSSLEERAIQLLRRTREGLSRTPIEGGSR